jgi:hypothetical protein
MHRIFGLLALGAAGFGVWVLVGGPGPETLERSGRTLAAEAPGVYSIWALGLLMGLVLAWLAIIDWREFPERFGAWLRLQRRRVGLLILGGACASVLLLF